jgi:hypothetical protein
MTTLRSIETICGNCGQGSEQTILTSTNSFGAPDLDFRPPPMKRSTMGMWLQECMNCRLVCHAIDDPPTGASDILDDPKYLAIVNDRSANEVLRKFKSWAYLTDALNLMPDAAFAHLHVAWLADDQKKPDLAKAERTIAVAKLSGLRNEGKLYPDQPGAAEALIADLWRRTGEFDNAIHEASRCASIAKEDQLTRICAFQTALARLGDADVHTIADA